VAGAHTKLTSAIQLALLLAISTIFFSAVVLAVLIGTIFFLSRL
jgi:hypothetical protein